MYIFQYISSYFINICMYRESIIVTKILTSCKTILDVLIIYFNYLLLSLRIFITFCIRTKGFITNYYYYFKKFTNDLSIKIETRSRPRFEFVRKRGGCNEIWIILLTFAWAGIPACTHRHRRSSCRRYSRSVSGLCSHRRKKDGNTPADWARSTCPASTEANSLSSSTSDSSQAPRPSSLARSSYRRVYRRVPAT